ncbi:MFS transporter [Salmonella enterica subsp. enterica]|nr:MFS transporter [Salmonella enterica subsp. enterica]
MDRGDGLLMQALDATILNTALPAIAHGLSRSPLAMRSAIIGYTLTVAMLIPVSGWLADRFGTRRVLLMVAVKSVYVRLAGLLRALSSLSGGYFSRHCKASAGDDDASGAAGVIAEPYRVSCLPVLQLCRYAGNGGSRFWGRLLGGVLVTGRSWHWIFLINIPIIVAGILYARKYMPQLHHAASQV